MTRAQTKTVIDWASKPEPWCDIGPQFRRECEAIVRGEVIVKVNPLRERRKRLGLTQQKLAEIAGFANGNTVCQAERGQLPGPAAKIAAALDRLEAE